MKQLSRDIANGILLDMEGRSGMDVFGGISRDIQEEIIDSWAELVEGMLTYYGVEFENTKDAE